MTGFGADSKQESLPWHNPHRREVLVLLPASKHRNRLRAASCHKLHKVSSNLHPAIKEQLSSLKNLNEYAIYI